MIFPKNIDLMDYSTNAEAQQAWTGKEFDNNVKLLLSFDDITVGSSKLVGTATADQEYSPTYSAEMANDGNDGGTRWSSDLGLPHWWKLDLGTAKVSNRVRINNYVDQFRDFQVQGSNDNTNWTTLYTGLSPAGTAWREYTWVNTIAYRYYRLYMTTTYYVSPYCGLWEVGFYNDMIDDTGNHKALFYNTAQVSTSQYKFGSASLSLDGTGYLVFPDSADWNFGTGAFTIDTWVRWAVDPSSLQMLFSWGTDGNNRFEVTCGGTTFDLGIVSGGAVTLGFNCPFNPNATTWYHLVVSRIDSGNLPSSWRMFIDGVSQTLTKSSGNWNATVPDFSGDIYIGRFKSSATYFFNGWMDEIRIVKGQAIWTSNFTPPTKKSTPYIIVPEVMTGQVGNALNFRATTLSLGKSLEKSFSANLSSHSAVTGKVKCNRVGECVRLELQEGIGGIDAYTFLYAKFNGTDGQANVLDSSGNNQNGVFVGNAQFSTDDKKIGSASYKGDGTGDYISYSARTDFAFGTGNFTLECYFKFNANETTKTIFCWHGVMTCEMSNVPYMCLKTFSASNGWSAYYNISAQLYSATWYHFALVNNGGTLTMYINGVSQGSTSTFSLSSAIVYIGSSWFDLSARSWNGYIDEVRFSNVARYTTAFTPPTEALVTDSNTKLLLHCEKVNVSDVGGHLLTYNGTAQLDTAQKVFGTTSLYTSVNGDSVTIPNHTDFNFVDGADWTIDFRLRLSATPTDWMSVLSKSDANSPWNGYMLGFNPSRYLGLATSTNGLGGVRMSETLSNNVWYHIAVVHDNTGDTLKLYVDGVVKASTTGTSGINWTNVAFPLYIGSQNGFADRTLKGWIDELRITRGVARWILPFTPPSQEYDATVPVYSPVDIKVANVWQDIDWNIQNLDVNSVILSRLRVTNADSEIDMVVDNLRAIGHRVTLDKFDYETNGDAQAKWTSPTSLQVYSESSIKRNSFSTKLVASEVGYVRRAMDSVPLDFSGMNFLTGDVRANRAGTNVKLQLFDGVITPASMGSDCVLLLHFDGTNNQQTTVDSSPSAHTMTLTGGSTSDRYLDSTQTKFGTTSFYSSYYGWVISPASSDFDLTTGDLTIDFWFRYEDWVGGSHQIIGMNNSNADTEWLIYTQATGMIAVGERGVTELSAGTGQIALDTWYHIAVTRSGSTTRIFIDGVLKNSGTGQYFSDGSGKELRIMGQDSGNYNCYGWIDEVRIRKGTAEWTANFTPPTAPYTTTASYSGTWIEKTIPIKKANTWERFVWDFRRVETGAPIHVVEARIEVTNADIANDIYFNNFEASIRGSNWLEVD